MSLNVELLENSFAQVESKGTQLTETFYALLFADYPEVRPLFAKTSMETQSKHLFQSLVFTVEHLRKSDELVKALKGLGTRHVQYGVLPLHYPMVGSSLLKAFEATLGTAWTPDVHQAWTEAYGVVSQLMLEGAEYSPEQLNLPNTAK